MVLSLCSCGSGTTVATSGGDINFFEETHSADKSGSINTDRVQPSVPSEQTSVPDGETPTSTESTTAPSVPTDDISVFNSRNFLLVGSMYVDADTGYVPIKIAYKIDKVSMQTQLSGLSASVIMYGKDGLLLFPDMKLYYNMPNFILGGFNLDSIGSDSSAEYLGETEEILDGCKVVCKNFKSEDGSSVKYYMSGDNMLKMSSYDADGVIEMDLVIDELTPDPPEAYFAVPDGYEKGKSSDLLAFGGGSK